MLRIILRNVIGSCVLESRNKIPALNRDLHICHGSSCLDYTGFKCVDVFKCKVAGEGTQGGSILEIVSERSKRMKKWLNMPITVNVEIVASMTPHYDKH